MHPATVLAGLGWSELDGIVGGESVVVGGWGGGGEGA